MDDKLRVDPHTIALRAAKEFQEGQYVNLGFAIPTLPANIVREEKKAIIFRSENPILAYGPIVSAEEADWDLVNAGGEPAAMAPGICSFDCVDSFGMMRGGHIDVAIPGAVEVPERGDLANWAVTGKWENIGGSMDLSAGAKKVIGGHAPHHP